MWIILVIQCICARYVNLHVCSEAICLHVWNALSKTSSKIFRVFKVQNDNNKSLSFEKLGLLTPSRQVNWLISCLSCVFHIEMMTIEAFFLPCQQLLKLKRHCPDSRSSGLLNSCEVEAQTALTPRSFKEELSVWRSICGCQRIFTLYLLLLILSFSQNNEHVWESVLDLCRLSIDRSLICSLLNMISILHRPV